MLKRRSSQSSSHRPSRRRTTNGTVEPAEPELPTSTLPQLRQTLGISQAQLGDALGVGQPQILKWERASELRTGTVRSIVENLGRVAGVECSLRLLVTVGGQQLELLLPHTGGASDQGEQPVNVAALRAFRIRAWSDPRLERAFVGRGLIAIGDDETELHGEQPAYPSDAQIRDRLRRDHPDEGAQTIGIWTAYWRIFFNEMREGDIVVFAPKTSWIAIGEIVGPYEYDASEPNGRLRHVRKVKWLATDMPRKDLDDDLRRVINAPGTVCTIGAPQAASRLVEFAAKS